MAQKKKSSSKKVATKKKVVAPKTARSTNRKKSAIASKRTVQNVVQKRSVGQKAKGTRPTWAMIARSHLYETRYFALMMLALFFASGLIGFAFSDQFSFFDPILEDLAGKVLDLSPGELIWFIFQNNTTTAFVGMVFGAALGLFPVINIMTNGALTGYVYAKVATLAGYGIIWRLLPHGIFELPAIFLSLGMGVHLGMFVFTKNPKQEFVRRSMRSLKTFVIAVIPLLVVAAIIEGLLIAFGS